MKINWNYIKALFLLTLVVFLYSFSSKRNAQKKILISEVKFEHAANLFMDETMVNKLLIQNGSSLENQPKSMVDLHGLEKRILAHPMVENAIVFLSVDGALQTLVKQRTPIARIQSKTVDYYLDRLGKKMPLSKNHTARVPLVSGTIDKTDWKVILKLLKIINKDDFLKKQIIGIHKNEKKEFELKTRIGNQTILIGAVKDLKSKFKKLKAFYNKVTLENGISKYVVINLKYKNQVICTKK